MKVEIKGIAVVLRELRDADAENMVRVRNMPKNNQFLSNAGQTIILQDQLNWQQSQYTKTNVINFVALVNNEFAGTCSIYDIENTEAEFGRYIITHPIAAVEAEYLSLKYAFEVLGLTTIICKTVKANTKVWKQHTKLGFTQIGEDFDDRINQARVLQTITKDAFEKFNYNPILTLLQRLVV